MNNRTVLSIDRCIEVLMGYVSARVSDSFMGDKDLDEGLTELIYASSDLIRTRAKIDKTRKAVTEVNVPEFLEQ